MPYDATDGKETITQDIDVIEVLESTQPGLRREMKNRHIAMIRFAFDNTPQSVKVFDFYQYRR